MHTLVYAVCPGRPSLHMHAQLADQPLLCNCLVKFVCAYAHQVCVGGRTIYSCITIYSNQICTGLGALCLGMITPWQPGHAYNIMMALGNSVLNLLHYDLRIGMPTLSAP